MKQQSEQSNRGTVAQVGASYYLFVNMANYDILHLTMVSPFHTQSIFFFQMIWHCVAMLEVSGLSVNHEEILQRFL